MKKLLLCSFLFLMSFGAFAQNSNCTHPYGPTDDDSLRCTGEITLFRTFLLQKSYKEAYTAWRNIVTEFPCSWDGIYNNKSVQDMFKGLITSENDSLRKEHLIDSLLWVFDTRHQFFPKKFSAAEGKGWKAVAMFTYRKKEAESAFQLLIDCIDGEQENTQPTIFNLYFNVAEQFTKVKKDTNYVIDAYEKTTSYLDIAIDNCNMQLDKLVPSFINLDSDKIKGHITPEEYNKVHGKLSKDTARIMKYILNYQRTLANIEGKFTPYAPCSVLEQVYSRKLAENRTNISVLQKIVHTMQKSGCSDSKVFIEALEIVHKDKPSAQTAFLMGVKMLKNNELDAAISYCREAANLFETFEKKANAYYVLASALMAKQNYSEARSAALEAIKYKPSYGMAYILIGDMYSFSGGRCSGDNALPMAYNWAAADKYNRAVAVDPSCESVAREKRSKLAFPSGEEKFKRGLKAGDTYRIGCWIQENTSVR